MQIGPIPESRVLPAMKAPPVDPQLTALFAIEGTAQAGDDTYSRGAKKAAGAEEDEKDDGAGEEQQSAPEPPGDAPMSSIDYFA